MLLGRARWLALGIVSSACGGCDRAQVSVPDAAAIDASAPAKDASRPADREIPDVHVPFPGTWIPIPGAPPECGARLAADPARDVPATKWVPCPSGRKGCQKLDVSWTQFKLYSLFLKPVRLVNGTPYFNSGRNYPTSDLPTGRYEWSMGLVEPIDKPPVFAYALPPTADLSLICVCSVDVHPGGVAMALLANALSKNPFMSTAPWSNLLDITTTQFSITDLGSFGGVQAMSAGAGAMFLATADPFNMAVFDIAKRTMTPMGSAPRPPAEHPVGVKDGALAVAGATGGLWFVRPDASYVRLVDSTANQVLFNVEVDRANGDALVWREGDLFDLTNLNLWTAPYATTPPVARRKVTHLGDLKDGGGVLVANAGMALMRETLYSSRLVRLSDGWGWSIPAEPNERMIHAVWVDDAEVWVGTGPELGVTADYTTSVMRLQRSELGSPNVAPQ